MWAERVGQGEVGWYIQRFHLTPNLNCTLHSRMPAVFLSLWSSAGCLGHRHTVTGPRCPGTIMCAFVGGTVVSWQCDHTYCSGWCSRWSSVGCTACMFLWYKECVQPTNMLWSLWVLNKCDYSSYTLKGYNVCCQESKHMLTNQSETWQDSASGWLS